MPHALVATWLFSKTWLGKLVLRLHAAAAFLKVKGHGLLLLQGLTQANSLQAVDSSCLLQRMKVYKDQMDMPHLRYHANKGQMHHHKNFCRYGATV